MTEAIDRLWAMSLQADLIILIVIIARACLGRYPKIYSYYLWAFVVIRLLCPIRLESPFSLQPNFSGYYIETNNIDNFEEAQTENLYLQEQSLSDNLIEDMQNHDTYADMSPEVINEGALNIKAPGYQENRVTRKFFMNVLRIVYLAGAAGFVIYYLICYIRVHRRVSDAVKESGNIWLDDGIDSPFVMGIICPKIYLPYNLENTEKEYVLRHERVHIRHHDSLIRIIGVLCICLHWWNPLVHLAIRLMNLDMEMFCDETVMRNATMQERKNYAKALLSYAEKKFSMGTEPSFGESHTRKRIKNIVKKQNRSLFVVCIIMILAVFCAIALMTVPKINKDAGSHADIANSDDETGNSGTADDSGSIAPSLSDSELAYLIEAVKTIPDFSADRIDADFFKDYLFCTYTSDFDKEEVIRYSQQYGFDISYTRVDYDEADETILRIFGKSLSEYGISTEDLTEDNGNLIYEDGSFLIAQSDSPLFELTLDKVTAIGNMTEVTLTKSLDDGEVVSHVMLYLISAENEWGYILNEKREFLIGTEPTGQIIEGQSYEVDMNPYGKVTFAAYEPDLQLSPYADVTFKLLKDGEEIYSFPMRGTGVRENETVFDGLGLVAFPDLNGDGYTDVVVISHYEHASGPIPSELRIFTYNPGGYFLDEQYLAQAYNSSHEEKTLEDIEAFAAAPENQDYYARTSIYGRWRITGYRLPDTYALSQEKMDSYIGTYLEYDNSFMWTDMDGEKITVAKYNKSVVDLEEITPDPVIYFEIQNETDPSADDYALFGDSFYLIDSEHAYVYFGGVYFEAVRG